jgi:aspartyl-tRNA(Asn)/glutamyl-tRNA(Gln) amidotransferase subunit B
MPIWFYHMVGYAVASLNIYPVFLPNMSLSKYEAVIGLEVHTQLLTNSKLFCGDSAAYGGMPNTHISPVTLAHPGTLPKMNNEVINYAIKLGLALGCTIEQYNYFARKNYFYPDLPKGYQVSQHTTPICKNGFVPITVNGAQRNIQLNRIHMEEDAGKSIHDLDEQYSCVDLNRAGVPLLEIVSEPDLHTGEEAYAYLTELRKLVRWLGVCDGNMEEGSMRCDANISIRPRGTTALGTKVEVKNINSIRNVKRAIENELQRLIEVTESGGTIVQETRGFDADKGTSYPMRSKEAADDYRYFPEPDLAPFFITQAQLDDIKTNMGILPRELENKYINELQLSAYDAAFICSDKDIADFFEAIIKHTSNSKAAANWLQGPVKSSTAASRIFTVMLSSPGSTPAAIADELNLVINSDSNMTEQWVDEVLARMPEKVLEYKKGKKRLLGLFTGEVKKLSRGKADIKIVNDLLLNKLK